MHIALLGDGPLAQPLAKLAERAGHTVHWLRPNAEPTGEDRGTDLVVLAGSRAAVEPLLSSIVELVSVDVVVVDATTPTEDDRRDRAARATRSGAAWPAALLPRARVVRAFASVPAEALAAVLNGSDEQQAARLAVPMAGDDRDAKRAVATFMHDIGVDPFDLGSMGASDVLDPGGALWGKAMSPVELLEAVGQLSGDG